MTGSRILLTLPVALVLVLCLAPMGMGFLIEQTYGSVIERAGESPEHIFHIRRIQSGSLVVFVGHAD